MSQAAYSIIFYRDLRLGTHYFRPGEFVSHDRLLQLCGSERVINRLVRAKAIMLSPMAPGMELSEGHELEVSPSGSAVLEPPSQELPGGAQHTEEHGEESAGAETGGEAGQDPSTDAPAGDEDPLSSGAAAEGEVTFDPELHTVDEVKAFVSEHPAMRDAITALELDGRKRKSLIDWLAAGE